MTTAAPDLQVLTDLPGTVNTPEATILEQIRHSVRLQHPQVYPQPEHGHRAVLVAGGPSIGEQEGAIVEAAWSGAHLVTVNGAYQWCLARNLKPTIQIVLEARPPAAAFLEPVLPGVRYCLASQCHPDAWRCVQDGDTWIWHACRPEDDSRKAVLDSYYGGRWHAIPGGTTVTIQGLMVLRSLGYLRMDLFGVDCCVAPDLSHHAYDQPQNDTDDLLRVEVFPTEDPTSTRRFVVTPWHLRQFQEMLQVITRNTHHFRVTVHGDGLLAHALRLGVPVTVREVVA
jgi:hypothetical protein